MLKKQLIFALAGLVIGNTYFLRLAEQLLRKAKRKQLPVSAIKAFDIHQFIEEEKKHLSALRQLILVN